MYKARFFVFLTMISLFSGCSSYEQFQNLADEAEMPSEVFKHDFNQTWQAVLEIMQKYDIALKNQEAGIIKTRWIDNTLQLNFNEAFGSQDMVKSARFKLVLNVVKGFKGNKEVTKVSIFKRQMVEKDFLQGWKIIRSDSILEKTILYRIDRILKREAIIKQIEDKKAKEDEKNF